METRRSGIFPVGYPTLDEIEAIHRHTQDFTACVFERERLDFFIADFDSLESLELTDAVVEVHDEIAFAQLRQTFQRSRTAETTLPANASCPAENFVVGEHARYGLSGLQHEARFHCTNGQSHTGRQPRAPAQQLLESLELARVVAQYVGVLVLRGTSAQQGR